MHSEGKWPVCAPKGAERMPTEANLAAAIHLIRGWLDALEAAIRAQTVAARVSTPTQ